MENEGFVDEVGSDMVLIARKKVSELYSVAKLWSATILTVLVVRLSLGHTECKN